MRSGERRRARSCASSASPYGPDFSGWNCTPYTRPCATALTNSLPYSAVPSTSSWSAGRGANELAW